MTVSEACKTKFSIGAITSIDKVLFSTTLFLLMWALFANVINHKTFDSAISAARIFLEASVYICLANSEAVRKLLKNSILLITSLNSLVILGQLAESLGLISLPLNSIPVRLYGIHNSEVFRHSGLLDGFQISTILSFLAILLLIEDMNRQEKFNYIYIVVILFNVVAVMCGSRTFSVFLPLFFIVNKKLQSVGLYLVFFILIYLIGLNGESSCVQYIHDRIMPVYETIFRLDFKTDYSFADTISQYRVPPDLHQLLIGNGEPRYPINPGGGDPTFSRWLLQSGLPAAMAVSLIIGVVLFKIAKRNGINNKLFILPLLASTIKGELVTSAGIMFILLIIFSSASAYKNANITN